MKVIEFAKTRNAFQESRWENKELRKCYRMYAIAFLVFAIPAIGLLLQTLIVNWSSSESMIERGFTPYEAAGFLCLFASLIFYGMTQAIWQAEKITRKKQ